MEKDNRTNTVDAAKEHSKLEFEPYEDEFEEDFDENEYDDDYCGCSDPHCPCGGAKRGWL